MLSVTQGGDDIWMRYLKDELNLKHVRYWTDSCSGTMTVQMYWSMPLGLESQYFEGNVGRAPKSVTLIAKALFRSTTLLTPKYALVSALNAVCDLPLLRTTDLDIRVEGWLAVQEELAELVDKHGVLRCYGLIKLEPCIDCKTLYKDEMKGAKLATRLVKYNEEFKEALGDDDEFDPRKFT